MKKLLLTLGIVGLGFAGKSQVIFSVEDPASIEGFYDFTSNGDGSNWGLASLAGVYVLDTIVLADDGASGTNAQGNPASATGCTALAPGSLTGKIAMVYRYDGVGVGNCGFGFKAKTCADAGAEAVIIVNREEAMVNMDGGTEGLSVTVPVIFVSLSTGQAILNAMNNGDDVIGFIGDKTGYYDNDISIFDNSVLRADFGAMPSQLAQDETELSVPLTARVYNYGVNNQTGITVTVTVNNGTEVYNEVSDPFDLNSGDSTDVVMPNFEMSTYAVGEYTVEYSLQMGVADEFEGDNVSTSNFFINDELWSYARLDTAVVAKDGFYRSSTLPTGEYYSCMLFNNANAGRLRTDGFYYGGVTVGAADTLTVEMDGQEVYSIIYEWNDPFTSAQDATFDNLNVLSEGSVALGADDAEATIFVPFDDIVQLEDDQNYLVCAISYQVELFHAFDTKSIYDFNESEVSLPRFPIKTGTSSSNFNPLGFGIAPGIALHVGTDLGIEENLIEASAFPNPSKDVVTVKLNASGEATLKVTDMAGRVVMNQTINVVGGEFTTNVNGMNAGTYIYALDFGNGTTSRFNVVVTK